MAWDILTVEPAHGICDVCKQHTCGVVDGKHKWIRTGMYDQYDDEIIIGYNCVKLWADNFGITKQVVEKEIRTQLLKRPAFETMEPLLKRPAFETMEPHSVWLWLIAHGIDANLKELKTHESLRKFADKKYDELVNADA